MVHLYTATGAVLALLALRAAMAGHAREAFAWLAVQLVIDSSDGYLARLVNVKVVAPEIDGNRLDDIVDYLTYVLVPAVMVVTAGLVPGDAGWAVAAAIVLSSAFGFSRTDAKTADHFFTGFPSYWNIVVFYLVMFRSPAVVNATLLLGLAVLVFVPIRYVYPSRTPVLQPLTLVLGLTWAAGMTVALVLLPDVPAGVRYASLLFPVYYVALSLALHARRVGRGTVAGDAA
jgi:phosphatidylcholine synthase